MVKTNRNISKTAFKVLYILKLLETFPLTSKEINECFKAHNGIGQPVSEDSISLYIQTLRKVGCNIVRPSKRNNYKYELKKHVFTMNISEKELESLVSAKQYYEYTNRWELIYDFKNLFNKLSKHVDPKDKQKIDQYLKNIFQRDVDDARVHNLIQQLKQLCSDNTLILVTHKSVKGGVKKFRIIADQLMYENDALYLWGIDVDTNEFSYLRIDRIDLIEKLDEAGTESLKAIGKPVIFKVYKEHLQEYIPKWNEKITDETPTYILVETETYNDFHTIQRLMSLGAACEVISPISLREKIVENFNQIIEKYG